MLWHKRTWYVEVLLGSEAEVSLDYQVLNHDSKTLDQSLPFLSEVYMNASQPHQHTYHRFSSHRIMRFNKMLKLVGTRTDIGMYTPILGSNGHPINSL